MQVMVNGEPLKNHPYRIQDSSVTDGGGALRPGGSQDMQALRNSQNTLLSGTGSSLLTPAQSETKGRGLVVKPNQELRTDSEGRIKLKDGQTVILTDAGKLGDTFEVIEEETEGYIQIAPVGNGEGIFSGEGGEVTFVNAKEDEGRNLYISKVYEAAQESSGWMWKVDGYMEELKEANRSDGSSEAEKGSVEVTLTINGEIFIGGPGQQFTVVNQLTGETSMKEWNGPTFMLAPWSVVIIPIEEETGDISYTLSESKEDQHRIVEYKDADGRWMMEGGWLEISQKIPKNDRPVEGTVAGNPVATITNEISAIGISSLVTKQMTEDSFPVPEGAELVWRVEQFNGVTWQPAEGVSYITLAGDWSKDVEDVSEAAVLPTCDRVLKTGPDGRIVLTKKQWEDGIDRQPAVYFADDYVTVNQYDTDYVWEGMYRVVEVMEESDEAWGMLKEYTSNWYSEQGNVDGLNISANRAGGFKNSNETAPIEIAKEMEGDSDETFTMILKQVLSLKQNTDFQNIGEGWEQNIVASEGKAGIPYTVCDTATGEVVAEKETGKNGEIYLKAGQYARLNLSNTLWTVSEEIGYTYKLKSLTPENETKLKRLNNNLMLINGDFPRTYTVVYVDDLENSAFEPQIYEGLKEGDETPAFEGTPTSQGYIFIRWEPEISPRVSASDADEDGVIYYRAYWLPKPEYTVIYTDGVKGEFVFPDQVEEKRVVGSETPQFKGTPTREGYKFDGWDPVWKEIVSGDDADENGKIVYTAKWKKRYSIIYKDGCDGEAFGDKKMSGAEGEETPPFGEDPVRNGYKFMGWSPAVQKYVSVDDADKNGEIVYTATWEKSSSR